MQLAAEVFVGIEGGAIADDIAYESVHSGRLDTSAAKRLTQPQYETAKFAHYHYTGIF
jgi:hypothetical protein